MSGGLFWMRFCIPDYIADTMHLTTLQHGAYLKLMFAYYMRGGPLPDDDRFLGRTTGLPGKHWLANREILAEFFIVADGFWTHKRIEQELQNGALLRFKKSRGGKASAAARGLKKKETASTPVEQVRNTRSTNPESGVRSQESYRDDGDDRARESPGVEPEILEPRNFVVEALEAIGVRDDPRWLGDGGIVRAWMNAGADFDLDILPTLIAVMARRNGTGPPRSLKYFDRAVMDAHATRTTPAAKGTPQHGKAGNGHRSGRRDSIEIIGDAIANYQRHKSGPH